MKLAYLASRFPKISETFVLYEVCELRNLGMDVSMFALIHEQEGIAHEESFDLVKETTYPEFGAIFLAQLYWLIKNPLRYIVLWVDVIKSNRHSLKFLSRALAVFPIGAMFAKKMKQDGIDHLHAHWASHATLAAYIINALANIPYSFTAHAHDIYVEQVMLDKKIDNAKFVVTISDFNVKFLYDLFGNGIEEKIHVVHCGVDMRVFAPRDKVVDQGKFTIISVARLHEMKGHKYLIEACAQLKKDEIPFHCVLIGDGEERERLFELVKFYGLESEIEFLGRQTRDQVSAMLAKSDVMVLPSVVTSTGKMEGIPVSLMEAMAIELTVVSTTISGIPELIDNGKNGILVPPRDVKALYSALKKLHGQPELRTQLGREARRKIAKEFNLKKNTRKLYDIFCQSIAGGTK